MKSFVCVSAASDQEKNEDSSPFKRGHTPSISAVMSDGMSSKGFPPLHKASWDGDRLFVQDLIQSGAHDVNEEMSNGSSALYVAAGQGHSTLAEFLIERKADVNKARDTGSTPLWVAASRGQSQVVDLLLLNNAHVNQPNRIGATPLYVGAQNGQVQVVEALVEAGGAVNQTTRGGETPLFIAAQKGHTGVVRYLTKVGAAVNQPRPDGSTSLWIAAAVNHVDVVKVLLEAGGDVNAKGWKGTTPRAIASKGGHLEVVKAIDNFIKERKNSSEDTHLVVRGLVSRRGSHADISPITSSPHTPRHANKIIASSPANSTPDQEDPPPTIDRLPSATRTGERVKLPAGIEEDLVDSINMIQIQANTIAIHTSKLAELAKTNATDPSVAMQATVAEKGITDALQALKQQLKLASETVARQGSDHDAKSTESPTEDPPDWSRSGSRNRALSTADVDSSHRLVEMLKEKQKELAQLQEREDSLTSMKNQMEAESKFKFDEDIPLPAPPVGYVDPSEIPPPPRSYSISSVTTAPPPPTEDAPAPPSDLPPPSAAPPPPTESPSTGGPAPRKSIEMENTQAAAQIVKNRERFMSALDQTKREDQGERRKPRAESSDSLASDTALGTSMTRTSMFQLATVVADDSDVEEDVASEDLFGKRGKMTAAVDFAEHRSGLGALFGKGNAVGAHRLMTFQDTPLKAALLKSNLNNDGVFALFKGVQGYMGDRSTRKSKLEIAMRLLTGGHDEPSMRDELMLQICKQIKGNPSREHALEGWRLLSLCLASFPPSDSVSRWIINFAQGAADRSAYDEEVARACANIIQAVPKIRRLGARKHVMSITEYESLSKGVDVSVPVWLMDDSQERMDIEPYTRVKDMIKALEARTGVQSSSNVFALFVRHTVRPTDARQYKEWYEKDGKNKIRKVAKGKGKTDPETCFVDTEKDVVVTHMRERVVEILAQWAARHKARSESAFPLPPIRFEFVYRARIVPIPSHPVLKDTQALWMVYTLVRRDFLIGALKVDSSKAALLSALILISDFSEHDDKMMGWIQQNVVQVIPQPLLRQQASRKMSVSEMRAAQQARIKSYMTTVLSLWEQIRKTVTGPDVARLAFLESLEKDPSYGMERFYVHQRAYRMHPERVLCGINWKGMRILDPEDQTVIEEIAYVELVTWGLDADKLIIVKGTMDKQDKLLFRVDVPSDGLAMNKLLTDYTSLMVDKGRATSSSTMEEIPDSVDNSHTGDSQTGDSHTGDGDKEDKEDEKYPEEAPPQIERLTTAELLQLGPPDEDIPDADVDSHEEPHEEPPLPPGVGNVASTEESIDSKPSFERLETDPATLPPGWVRFLDPTTEVPYYLNPATGQTSWEKPT